MPFTRWHFELGLYGLAMLRTGSITTDEQLDEYAAALGRPRPTDPDATRVAGGGVEHDVVSGYARWAPVYDAPGNPLIELEQPTAREILDTWPTGWRVLDAACGTGRHTLHLAALGHEVTGVDQSREMLDAAAKKATANGARIPFAIASTGALPFPTDAYDAAVCSLLFDHLPSIDPTVSELARVVRPGGRLLISNIHPSMSIIGANAAFRDANDESHFMRSHVHWVSSYLQSFRDHGLTVLRCAEPCWHIDMARAKFSYVDESVLHAAVVGLPMALIWELEA
jgi:ubiquinone/menaquinone biosynthesis C-methylase UbiE